MGTKGATVAGGRGVGGQRVVQTSVLVFPAQFVGRPDTSTLGIDLGRCCFSPYSSWIFWIFENPVAQEEEEEEEEEHEEEEKE